MSGYGDGPYGVFEYGGPYAKNIQKNAKCAPVVRGSLSVVHIDLSDVERIVATDDGDGNLVVTEEWVSATNGQAGGSIDYRTGLVSVSFSPPEPGRVGIRYLPAEGGCPDICGACKTHKVRLTIVPGDEINRNQTDLSDAFRRLNAKIKDITPIHVERVSLLNEEEFTVSFSMLYDLTLADVIQTDTGGEHVLFEE